jgi:hypothetical protein
VKLEEHYKHHPLASQVARPPDRKQAHRQNLAMTFAGGAILVTIAISMTLINDFRENARLLSELGSDISDINLLVGHHLAGTGRDPVVAVANASADKTLHLEDTPRSATPVSAQIVRIAANTLAKRGGGYAQPGENRVVSSVIHSRYDSQHEPLTDSDAGHAKDCPGYCCTQGAPGQRGWLNEDSSHCASVWFPCGPGQHSWPVSRKQLNR